jgi:hypothetical protein
MPDSPSPPSDLFGPVIFSYSRADAIADGVLIDVTDLAREAGFRWPIAVTAGLFSTYLDPPTDLIDEGQSFRGRLWDVLSVLLWTIATRPSTDTLLFNVLFILSPGLPPVPVKLKAVCGPDDSGAPCITVMLPDED